MKNGIIILSFLLSLNLHASCVAEAQFIGKISTVGIITTDTGVTDCYFSVDDFSTYNQNNTCPLSEDEAAHAKIVNYDCHLNLSVGDDVSGVMVKDANSQFHIE